MIKDIESGRVNMIITKDMPRLGRNYIGTGELIERYFPNNKLTKTLDKTYIDMLKGIIDEEQYIRVSEN